MNDLKSVTPSPKRKNLTVNISKVKGDLDSPNPLNGSDFFSFISIGEFKKVETNKYYNLDEINQNWIVTGQIYGEQGEVVKVKGSDDGNAGEIEFVIN